MAKRFIQISLATKLRVLFGLAILGIIFVGMYVPWVAVRLLAERGVQSSAEDITRLRLNEWLNKHPTDPAHSSEIAALYTQGEQLVAREGPRFVKLNDELVATPPLGSAGRMALKAFARNTAQNLAVVEAEDELGRRVYRCFLAVRAESSSGRDCQSCHGFSAPVHLQYQPAQLVGIVAMTSPRGDVSLFIVSMFAIGGILSALLSIIIFAVITQRLILRPVRHLRDMADKVTEGDMSIRSTISTGDELERLGDSFNEMLTTLSDQHTQLRQANRALDLKLNEIAESNVTLYQANQVKTEFLANVSHELRTPLNSVMGFAELLSDWPDERVKRYGKNISASAKNLLDLINDLLDLAKMQAGRANIRPGKLSVIDMCNALLALMEPVAAKREVQISGELASDLPIVTTDPGKLQQILYNLLSNAVKFTPAGGKVVLSAEARSDQRAGRKVEQVAITVTDTGPGIAEADQKHIFEKFYQADGTLSREAGGSGLGLAIAKELAQLLQGQLALKSSPGQGAAFTVVLPVTLEPPRPPDDTRT